MRIFGFRRVQGLVRAVEREDIRIIGLRLSGFRASRIKRRGCVLVEG